MSEETRSNADNRQQWPILQAFAAQKQWPVNGVYMLVDAESWKDILTSAFREETQPRIAAAFSLNVPGNIDHRGVVMLGKKTREFKKKEWPEWMAFLNAAAAECGIKVPLSKAQQSQYEHS